MSVTDPKYSGNKFLIAIEHIGHAVHEVFSNGATIEKKIAESVQVTEQAAVDAPTVVKDVTAVVTTALGGAAVIKAVSTALAGFGTNPAADVAAAAALAAAAPQAGTYVQNLEAALKTLVATLGLDWAQFEAILNPPAAPPTT